MSSRIDCYFDCVSLYSYFAILFLLRNKDALTSQGVKLDLCPMFLSGVVQQSGNKPPWTLPARARYMVFDRKRATKHFDTPDLKMPDKFPINTLMLQRCLTYIKAQHPYDKFEAAVLQGLKAMWEEKADVADPETIAAILSRLFSKAEVENIMQAVKQPEWKAKLNETTKAALDKGAYGAPWFWVTNRQGEAEPFFGSDRFHFMWPFLGLEHQQMKLIDTSSKL